jgi:hypothetical protein
MPVPSTHIIPVTTLRRIRVLSSPGRVLVKVGQKVVSTDIIAEADPHNQHILLDIRRAFGMSSIREAEAVVQRKIGERLQEGDVIAEIGDVFARVVRAPVNCIVVAISSGQVVLEILTSALQLKAGLAGEVVEIVPERGAVIESNGGLLQGVWGNNQVDQGLLSFAQKIPDDELTRQRLDVSMRGAVMFAGYCLKADALQMASQLPLRGLILGGMSPDLIQTANELSFPVVVLEGFGKTTINPVAFRLLATNEKRDVCLNATNWNVYTGVRPEILILLPASGQPPLETGELTTGKVVRVVAPPYRSQTGRIIRIRPGLTTLTNGLRAPAADIQLETNEEVTVPLANLDLLE